MQTGPWLSREKWVGGAHLQSSSHPQVPIAYTLQPQAICRNSCGVRGGGESFRNGRQKGTTSKAVGGGQSLSPFSPSSALAVASLALAPGCCYVLGMFVHSFNQPTFMEHLLFVENLFVNSIMQTTNLLIKYLLFIHFLVRSFVLSNELTSQHILNSY